jgi:hypothetical protein
MNVGYIDADIDIDIDVRKGINNDANVQFCKICVSYNMLSHVYHIGKCQ